MSETVHVQATNFFVTGLNTRPSNSRNCLVFKIGWLDPDLWFFKVFSKNLNVALFVVYVPCLLSTLFTSRSLFYIIFNTSKLLKNIFLVLLSRSILHFTELGHFCHKFEYHLNRDSLVSILVIFLRNTLKIPVVEFWVFLIRDPGYTAPVWRIGPCSS